MNLQFKEEIWRGGFRPTLSAEELEDRLRSRLGLTAKYESAHLCLGRSLAETTTTEPARSSERGKSIPGEFLFGDEIDLWISTFVLGGELGGKEQPSMTLGHWSKHIGRIAAAYFRWSCLNVAVMKFASCHDLLIFCRTRRALPGIGGLTPKTVGEIKIPVGPVSTTFPGGKPVEVIINAPGVAPHIAFMGKNGSGKTTTGIQLAIDLMQRSGVPLLFIDPKGEFVNNGKLAGKLADSGLPINAIEVGQDPIPLDFLPDPSVGSASVHTAAMQFRDSIAMCCGRAGDVQQDLLRTAVEKVIKFERKRDLPIIKDAYQQNLMPQGKAMIAS